MALTQGAYQAARIGADVRAGVSMSAERIANRATNKFVGRRAVGMVMGGTPGAGIMGATRPAPFAVGVGVAAGIMPGRAGMVAGLFNLSRSLNDIDTVISGDPSRLLTRMRNKLVGRALIKRVYAQVKVTGRRKVEQRLLQWENTQRTTIRGLSAQYATAMEQHAKMHAPWQDQTGQTRASITGAAHENPGTRFLVTIGHGVPWGKQLELRRHGAYAILRPTRDNFVPEFLKDIQRMAMPR